MIAFLSNVDFSMFSNIVQIGSSGGTPFLIICGFDYLGWFFDNFGFAITMLRSFCGAACKVVTGFWFVVNLPAVIRGNPHMTPPLIFADPLKQMDNVVSTVLTFGGDS